MLWPLVTVVARVGVSCATEPSAGGGESDRAGSIVAQVASYDLVANRASRIMGLFGADRSRLVSYGRFDNVTTEAELAPAAKEVLSQ